MSKAVLVIDMPENCEECPYLDDVSYTCGAFEVLKQRYTKEVPDEGEPRPDWCPLKALPEKKKPSKFPVSPGLPWKETDYEQGWNSCLDEIDKSLHRKEGDIE